MRAERGYGILSCLAALAVLAVLLVSVGFVPEHSVQAAGNDSFDNR